MAERTVSLAELVDENQIEVGAGRPRSVAQDQGILPILRVADVLDGKIGSLDLSPSPESHSWDLGPKVSCPGDIVLTVKGTVGRVALMPSEGPRFAYSPQLCYFRPRMDGPLVARYLYYWFKSADFWIQANALKGQTDMADFISLGDILSLKLRLPHREKQESVAGVLGALDDKIAANERIAMTAEVLLRNMYLACDVAGSEIRVGDIGHLVRESVNPPSLRGDEPYIGLEHMPRKQVWLNSWGNSSAIGSTKSAFKTGDILFGKLRPYFHKVGIAQVDGVCSTDIIVVRASRTEYRSWLLMALSSDEVVAHATARSDGTRMPRAKWSDLADFNIPWPSAERMASFEDGAAALIQRAESAAAENHALVRLRNTLLPQLMSGKLRIRDAEKIVEDAV
ncbi:restriction endonuclease subunit S [Streptomyces sp. NPDC058001]|uniref:restriction endonuclease subunit S n=1 Tax=Streptomyces sp. NPDC058001 TaxID=3346300 RepID=UPI0036E4DCE5